VRIYTSSWFAPLPPTVVKVGISRGVPRRYPAGYRRLTELQPGPWFASVSPDEYRRRYLDQLHDLDADGVVAKLTEFGRGRDVALLCYERPQDAAAWCHRGLVAAWLWDEIGLDVREYGMEAEDGGWRHPKLHAGWRR
jgi:Active DUF488-N3 subclade